MNQQDHQPNIGVRVSMYVELTDHELRDALAAMPNRELALACERDHTKIQEFSLQEWIIEHVAMERLHRVAGVIDTTCCDVEDAY